MKDFNKRETKTAIVLSCIIAFVFFNLISVPFWLFGGYKWGLSANATISIYAGYRILEFLVERTKQT